MKIFQCTAVLRVSQQVNCRTRREKGAVIHNSLQKHSWPVLQGFLIVLLGFVSDGFQVHSRLQTPLIVVLAFIFMLDTIGPSALAGIAIVIVVVPLNGILLIKYVRRLQVRFSSFSSAQLPYFTQSETYSRIMFHFTGKADVGKGQENNFHERDFVWNEGMSWFVFFRQFSSACDQLVSRTVGLVSTRMVSRRF